MLWRLQRAEIERLKQTHGNEKQTYHEREREREREMAASESLCLCV
jgi:hypothetical protein